MLFFYLKPNWLCNNFNQKTISFFLIFSKNFFSNLQKQEEYIEISIEVRAIVLFVFLNEHLFLLNAELSQYVNTNQNSFS